MRDRRKQQQVKHDAAVGVNTAEDAIELLRRQKERQAGGGQPQQQVPLAPSPSSPPPQPSVPMAPTPQGGELASTLVAGPATQVVSCLDPLLWHPLMLDPLRPPGCPRSRPGAPPERRV